MKTSSTALEERLRVPPDQRLGELLHDGAVDGAQRLGHRLVASALGAAGGDHLVEQRERVAHAALGLADDQRERARRRCRPSPRRQICFSRCEHPRGGDAAEVVALAAGEDGVRELVRLGGREDELHVPGRLLERLEQRVERRPREHVHLVDDVDLVAVALRQVLRVLANLAHVLDAVVGRAVDLRHVDRGAGGDLGARLADAAGVGGGALARS